MIDQRIIDQFNQRAPFALKDATVLVLAKIGSHSHGTYIEPTDPQAIDDVDYMGVVIPPLSFTLGIDRNRWEGLNFQFEELDCVFYSFDKFISLLLKANPNVLGLLWLRSEFYVAQSPEWEMLREVRNAFSSTQAYNSFMGYAHGQMKKMTSFDLVTQDEWDSAVRIITNCGWTVEQVVTKAQRNMPLHYPEKATVEQLPSYFHTKGGLYGIEMVEEAVERIIKIHARHFQGYMGEKRKGLVRKYGYDTKNAAHLIRLMRMCVDFLGTRMLFVYRDYDGDHIRAIKSGKFSLDDVKAEAELLFRKAEYELRHTLLPLQPDKQKINIAVVAIHLSAYGLTYAHD